MCTRSDKINVSGREGYERIITVSIVHILPVVNCTSLPVSHVHFAGPGGITLTICVTSSFAFKHKLQSIASEFKLGDQLDYISIHNYAF